MFKIFSKSLLALVATYLANQSHAKYYRSRSYNFLKNHFDKPQDHQSGWTDSQPMVESLHGVIPYRPSSPGHHENLETSAHIPSHLHHHHHGFLGSPLQKEITEFTNEFLGVMGPMLFPLPFFLAMLPFALPAIPIAIYLETKRDREENHHNPNDHNSNPSNHGNGTDKPVHGGSHPTTSSPDHHHSPGSTPTPTHGSIIHPTIHPINPSSSPKPTTSSSTPTNKVPSSPQSTPTSTIITSSPITTPRTTIKPPINVPKPTTSPPTPTTPNPNNTSFSTETSSHHESSTHTNSSTTINNGVIMRPNNNNNNMSMIIGTVPPGLIDYPQSQQPPLFPFPLFLNSSYLEVNYDEEQY